MTELAGRSPEAPTRAAHAACAAQTEERRKRRSSDPLIALHYQLAHTRQGDALEAIVLADASGVVVAGAGSWVLCEELAAYAPILAQSANGTANDVAPLPARVAALREDASVHAMQAAGQPLLLCALPRKPRRGAIGGLERVGVGGGDGGRHGHPDDDDAPAGRKRPPRSASDGARRVGVPVAVGEAGRIADCARGVARILETTL